MATSRKRIDANNRNSKLSTGPVTPEGKKKASRNALKHGMTAIIIGGDENSSKVESERAEWVDCLKPRDAVELSLVDWSFRAKRHLFRISDAEDGAIALRLRNAREKHESGVRERFEQTLKRMDAGELAPEIARNELIKSVMGTQMLMSRLNALAARADAGDWSAREEWTLLKLLGQSHDTLPSDRARRAEAMHTFHHLDRTIKSPTMLMPEPCDIGVNRKKLAESATTTFVYYQERLDISLEVWDARLKTMRADMTPRRDAAKPEADRALASIKDEIAHARHDLCCLYAPARKLDNAALALALHEARFDPSDEGRLRRRYMSDAQRDFLKTLKAAQDACRRDDDDLMDEDFETAEQAAEPAEPAAEPVADPAPEPETAAPASRNEPNAPAEAFIEPSPPLDADSMDFAELDALTAPIHRPPLMD